MDRRRILIISGIVMFVSLMAHFLIAMVISESIKTKESSRAQTMSEQFIVRLNSKISQHWYALSALGATLGAQGKPLTPDIFGNFVRDLQLLEEFSSAAGVGLLRPGESGIKVQLQSFATLQKLPDPRITLGKEAYRLLATSAFRSMRTGKPSLTKEIEWPLLEGVARVVVFMNPIFKSGEVIDSPEAREAAIQGWVFLALPTRNLLHDTLGSEFSLADVLLFQGDMDGQQDVLFSTLPKWSWKDQETNLDIKRVNLQLGDQPWTLFFSLRAASSNEYVDAIPQGIVLFGTVVSLLLGLLLWSTLNTKLNAQELAQVMTARLEARTEELAAMVNAFPGMASWIDRDLRYLGVNAELASSYKRKPEEFFGEEVGKISSQESGVQFRKMVSDFFVQPNTRRITSLTMPSLAGTKHYLSTMQKYHNGERVMIVSIDITEQKHLERQIEETTVKAQHSARMSALGEMAGGMAHEINNPLTIIYAKASIIKRMIITNRFDKDKAVEALNKVEQTADRISKIIRGLRSIARDGENDPFQATPLVSLVTDTVELCRHRLNNKDIRFEYPQHLSPKEDLDCRATQIVQVLLNLVNNAYDAVIDSDERWVKLDVQLLENYIEFSVTDSGLGIPENIRDKIMQPFFTTKEIGKGTGLGLSISKGIAESHTGSLFIDPHSRHTRFVLRLPRRHVDNIAA